MLLCCAAHASPMLPTSWSNRPHPATMHPITIWLLVLMLWLPVLICSSLRELVAISSRAGSICSHAERLVRTAVPLSHTESGWGPRQLTFQSSDARPVDEIPHYPPCLLLNSSHRAAQPGSRWHCPEGVPGPQAGRLPPHGSVGLRPRIFGGPRPATSTQCTC
jgi:hypothetical protein